MKNVSLVQSSYAGKPGWKLVNPDGSENIAFSAFCGRLLQHQALARNTVKVYCRALANFYDYLIEVCQHLAVEEPSEGLLLDIIESWNSYLVLGPASGDEIVRRVNSTLPSPQCSRRTSALYHAGLKRFLQMSESLRRKLSQLQELGLIESYPRQMTDSLYVGMKAKRRINFHEKRSIMQNDLLASVIRGGSKLAKFEFFPHVRGLSQQDVEYRGFPYDLVIELINSAKSYRDKTLYAAMAASGGRISEITQLLVCDVNTEEREILLVDPRTRDQCEAYKSLTEEERSRLVWKSRKTPHTFLIEPFASSFFENLEKYLKEEMPIYAESGQQFLFYISRGTKKRRPLFLAKYESIYRSFINATNRILGKGHGYSPHSLRHMYGMYLVNYCPNTDGGYGLPESTVQTLMGHAEPKTTSIYAKISLNVRKRLLEIANRRLMLPGEPKTILEYEESILKRDLKRVQDQIKSSITSLSLNSRENRDIFE